MSDLNLPSVPKSATVEVASSPTPKSEGSRSEKVLLTGGLIAVSVSLGLIAFTQNMLLAAALGCLGMVCLGIRQLVNKSLRITSAPAVQAIGTVQVSLQEIKKQTGKAKFLENVEDEGLILSQQGKQLLAQYKALKDILAQKFDTSEITYARYLTGIENSCLAIGETLLQGKALLENLNLTALEKNQLWHDQLNKFVQLTNMTKQALSQLTELYNSLNEITTKERHRDRLEQTMDQLKELANRAKIYSK